VDNLLDYMGYYGKVFIRKDYQMDKDKFEYIVLEKTKYGNYFVKGVFETPQEGRKMQEGLEIISKVSKDQNTYHVFCNYLEE
jgi:hypothetical protein